MAGVAGPANTALLDLSLGGKVASKLSVTAGRADDCRGDADCGRQNVSPPPLCASEAECDRTMDAAMEVEIDGWMKVGLFSGPVGLTEYLNCLLTQEFRETTQMTNYNIQIQKVVLRG